MRPTGDRAITSAACAPILSLTCGFCGMHAAT
jgi:hypothetical protein